MEDKFTYEIIGLAMKVHTVLGRGLLERAYLSALERELIKAGHRVERQKAYPLVYEGEVLEERAYVADLVVDDRIILELKTVNKLIDEHKFQLLTYLKLAGIETGLLINFNAPSLRNGVRRVSLSDRKSELVTDEAA